MTRHRRRNQRLLLALTALFPNGQAFVATPSRKTAVSVPFLSRDLTGSRRLSSRNAIPSNINIDIELPSWLVDSVNQASLSLEDSVKAAEQLSASLLSPTAFLSSPNDDAMTAKFSQLVDLALTPWHVEAVALFGVAGSLLYLLQQEPSNLQRLDAEAPYEPGTDSYDPAKADVFYQQRPWLVVQRILRLGLLTGSFNVGLLWDWLVLGKLLRDEEYTALKKAEPERAKKALKLCNQLGPTFIKLGQALSIRTDLIPEAYALELRQLQDAVPPFDSDTARQVLKQELGVDDLSTIFSSLSSEPVASASIGQVYRGTLASTGQDVAVKVQRPGILAEIALDLHVLRILTPIQTILQNAANGIATSQADIDLAVSLVDEWGRGFVAETDYRLEARNTMEFEAAMRARGLDAVCAPRVVEELVTDRVLVTEWVEGTRLDRDASPDVPRLCGVAINAYLTMLLDTGVLHCDPHPGNLLRTTDGKLCVLDWGMTLNLPPNLQYALLELIAHINVENYDAIPQDFINLGFSPEGVTADRLRQSGITEGLTFAFRQLSAGGGPKKIQERVKTEFRERYGAELSDQELRQAARSEMLERMEAQLASEGVDVKGVTNVMEEMSKRNRELFQLPPYVLYVARAFSTLEGIGLSIDEDYAIVQECYPYLARRLFTDKSPRAKRALRAMLGLSEEVEHASQTRMIGQMDASSSALALVQSGTAAATAEHNGAGGGNISPGKLIEMSQGFASYTAATADVDRDGAGRTAAVNEFANLLLDPKGSTLQDILVDETARLGDAAARTALRATLLENPAAKMAKLALQTPKQLVEQSELLKKAIPSPVKKALLDRPAEVPQLVEELLAVNGEDEKLLSTAGELGNAVVASQRTQQQDNSGTDKQTPGREELLQNGRRVASFLLSPENEATRNAVVEKLPGVTALGRRLGAGLLRRAAYRTDQTGLIPERARRAIIEANHALADAVDVKEEEVLKQEEQSTLKKYASR